MKVYPIDGLAIFILIILGLQLFIDFASGRPISDYMIGITIGWAIIHTYYWYQRRKKNSYPKNWIEIRKNVLKRDNYSCCNCNNTKKLHVHHIVPLARGGTNNLTNMATLCEKCHMQLHPHMR